MLVLCTGVDTVVAETKTIYVQDNRGFGSMYIHHWGGGGDTTWPGDQITITQTIENSTVYSVTIDTDWDGFIRGLKNIDFRGVLSFETAPVLSSFPAVMKQDVLSFIARIGEYMSGEIVGSR